MISVVIATIGRDSLREVKESATGADEIIIANNGKQLVDNQQEAIEKTTGDIIVWLNDWIALNPGWKDKLLAAIEKVKGGVVSFHPNIVITGAVGRQFMNERLGGYIFHPDYIHYHCDQEIGEKARRHMQYTEVLDMVRVLPKTEDKQALKRNDTCRHYDWETYYKRQDKGFPAERVIPIEERNKYL